MKLRETLRTCYDTPDTLATASADGTVTVQSWRYRFAAHHLVTEIQRQQKKTIETSVGVWNIWRKTTKNSNSNGDNNNVQTRDQADFSKNGSVTMTTESNN